MRSSSASVSSSRPSSETFSTSWRVSAAAILLLGARLGGQAERSRSHQLGDHAAAEALRADLHRLVGAVDGDPHLLQVGLELPARDAGDLGADAAQVLGLAARGNLVPHCGTLPADLTFPSHVN